MDDPQARSERTLALFLLGAAAFSPPLLAIFAVESFVFGIPLLYAYLFAVWLGVVAALALISSTGSRGREEPADMTSAGSRGTEVQER